MRIKYTPIRDDFLNIKIKGEVIYIKNANGVNKVDFSSFPDGKMTSIIDYILSAEKKNGELIVTLCQAVDRLGEPIERGDFEVIEFNEIEVDWKTQEEIEKEKSAPKPPTDKERLESAEQAIINLMMEG